jgi:hypothetical protein
MSANGNAVPERTAPVFFAILRGIGMKRDLVRRIEVMNKATGSILLTVAAVVFSPQAWAQQVAAETPQTMLSAQIRTQGFTCDKALAATRDKKRSRPDHDVWVLKCSNATYRVSRAPDMAAKVEPLP